MPAPIPAEIAQTFELQFPVTVASGTVSELNARRPKVKDLKILSMGSDRDPVGSYNKFLASICTVKEEVINELDLGDYKIVQEWVSDFLPKAKDAD